MIAALTILTFIPPVAAATVPKDLDTSSDWSKPAIKFLSENQIIRGDSKGNFNPHKLVTRGEMVAVIVGALKLDTSNIPSQPTFSDVPKSHWAYRAVETAYRQGIVSGVSPGLFGINRYCTREQMISMYVRSLGFSNEYIQEDARIAEIGDFADSSKISWWARSNVAFACEWKMMSGVLSNGRKYFKPRDYSTREQMAVLTQGYIQAREGINKVYWAASNGIVSSNYSDSNFTQIFFGFQRPIYVSIQSITNSKGDLITNKYSRITYDAIEGYYEASDYYSNSFKPGETYTVAFRAGLRNTSYGSFLIKKQLIIPTPALMVKAVRSINCNQIRVDFNYDVSSATLNNCKITDDLGNPLPIKKLDGVGASWLILTMKQPILTPQTELHLTMSAIKARIHGAEYTFPAFAADIIPELDEQTPYRINTDFGQSGHEYTSIQLRFSEPIMPATVTVDSIPVGTAEGEECVISGLNLDHTQRHEVEITPFTDGLNTGTEKFYIEPFHL